MVVVAVAVADAVVVVIATSTTAARINAHVFVRLSVCVCVCMDVNRYKNRFRLEIRLRILCFFTPISRVKFIYSFTLIIYDEERNKLFDIFEFTLDFLNLSSALMILWHFSCDSAPHLHCWCTRTNQNTHS